MNTQTQVDARNVLTSGSEHGVARVKGQTHVVVMNKGKWLVSFTHLQGCQCNYCNGVYDYLIK